MASYGRTSQTGTPGSSTYRNDDATQLQDLPDNGEADAKEYDVDKQIKGLIF